MDGWALRARRPGQASPKRRLPDCRAGSVAYSFGGTPERDEPSIGYSPPPMRSSIHLTAREQRITWEVLELLHGSLDLHEVLRGAYGALCRALGHAFDRTEALWVCRFSASIVPTLLGIYVFLSFLRH